jgi:hypothetical protein
MADGGGSRIGGFFRGVFLGLLVCAIATVALSLSAPTPERAAPGDEAGVPGGAAADQEAPAGTAEPEATAPATATAPAGEPAPAVPQTGEPPAAEVIVVPSEGATDSAGSPTPAGDSATPQPTWETEPATGDAAPATQDSDAFSAPQNATGQNASE